jgi:hypothetical protein
METKLTKEILIEYCNKIIDSKECMWYDDLGAIQLCPSHHNFSITLQEVYDSYYISSVEVSSEEFYTLFNKIRNYKNPTLSKEEIYEIILKETK